MMGIRWVMWYIVESDAELRVKQISISDVDVLS